MKKINVGILGATGMVGQHYINFLRGHPWFNVTFLVASKKSVGKTYDEALQGKWIMNHSIPTAISKQNIYSIDDIDLAKKSCSLVFSALDGTIAEKYEQEYAKEGFIVISSSSIHRRKSDVPVIIPEINHDHLSIVDTQKKNRNYKGFIISKPNCSLQAYLIPLYPLKKFGIDKIMVSTMQAISGGGYSGVTSVDIVDNVIPFINKEEDKSEWEPKKILGTIENGEIKNNEDIKISAHCNRVPVLHGHLACVSVKFKNQPTHQEILNLWEDFKSLPQELNLPSAPKQPIVYLKENNRPQPRLDRTNDNGMAVSVGRLRKCNIFDWRFVGLSHNVIRGAVGGGILAAELIVKRGLNGTEK